LAGPPIEALLCDVFGTVVDWRTSLLNWFERFGRKRKVIADWAGFVDAWRMAYQPSMEPVRRGERSFVTLDVLHRESLDALLPAFGLDRIGESDRQHMVQAWHRLDPWPDSVPGLLRLKRKYIIATLSNGGVGLLVDVARHAGLPWDTTFSADHFRTYKPNPAVYWGAAELLDRPPSALLMVAAHPSDLAAARSCGLRSALISRPAEYGSKQPSAAASNETWDFAVTSFAELADCLGAPGIRP
jgi:2-haloacid dehalogenase